MRAGHLERSLVRHVVAIPARRDRELPTRRPSVDARPPTRSPRPGWRSATVPSRRSSRSTYLPPLSIRLAGIVPAEHAQPVALGVRLVAVDVDAGVGDVALVAGERSMRPGEERDQPVDVADVGAVVLDGIGVVGGPQQLVVARDRRRGRSGGCSRRSPAGRAAARSASRSQIRSSPHSPSAHPRSRGRRMSTCPVR